MLGSPALVHARFIVRAAPVASVALLVIAALQAAATATTMVLSGLVVHDVPDAVGRTDGARSVVVVLGGLFGVLAVASVLAALAAWLETVAAAPVLQAYLDAVLGVAVLPRGVTHLEHADTADRLADLEAEVHHWQFQVGLRGVWGLLRARLAGVSVVVLLASWRWWLPVPGIVAWSVLSWLENKRSATLFNDVDAGVAERLRRARYVSGLLTQRSAAKEVRLFGLVPWLVEDYRGLWVAAMAAVARRRARAGYLVLPGFVVVAAASAWGGWVIVAAGLDGSLGVARVTTLLLALLGLSAFGPQGDAQSSTNRVRQALVRLRSLQCDVEVADHQPQVRVDGVAAGIAFDDVGFTYPGSRQRVLNGLTLHVPAGQTIGIVGQNGVGKSTLVKLLCGLYPVDHGSVAVDGVDTWASRPRLGLIAQESVHFPLSLFDNVDAGSGWSGDRGVVDAALVDASLASVTKRAGLGVRLSADYEGGTDISGGQWQRVALARAMTAVRHGAGLLVLDEPTSALDVQREIELFDQLTSHRDSVTTVLVSHRLSGVRKADRIVVLADAGDGARVVEDGTHDELMATRARYWQMFTLQASRFSEGGHE